MSDPPLWPFCDAALARRLERAEAKSNADFVEARATLDPSRGACWIDVDGIYAMFDGPGSPLTQTFGLGVDRPATDAMLARIESFFFERGSEVSHEVCSLTDPSSLSLLNARGYQAVEMSTVLLRPVVIAGESLPAHGSGITIRVARRDEAELWAETSARGWSESPEAAAFMREIGAVMMRRRSTTPFFAEIDGEPVATGGLNIHDGIALFAGAATIPRFRNRGVQNALLADRLRFAAAAGCDLAMMVALPGSGSQRNAERAGFRVAYTRTKWQRAR